MPGTPQVPHPMTGSTVCRSQADSCLGSAILEVSDPIFRSLPSFEKSCIIASAYCVFVTGRGLDSAALYTIICALNGCTPEDLASAMVVKIPDNTSVKRLSHRTSSTIHIILAYPNMTGTVALSMPDKGEVRDDTVSSGGQISTKHLKTSIRPFFATCRLPHYPEFWRCVETGTLFLGPHWKRSLKGLDNLLTVTTPNTQLLPRPRKMLLSS
jgi:hypothetical protein